ncbi:hypothetical protein B4109_3110 [Geobacillus stearothermophilus]|uniref:Uncharacterized protein n=1 Tax=Geobacillus stearothermophilus TaxID=1422 RepID=A0A150MT12_GEOSE|nr:hypothetical protein B4109_3110 [Geobacillus stearothermophilus]
MRKIEKEYEQGKRRIAPPFCMGSRTGDYFAQFLHDNETESL